MTWREPTEAEIKALLEATKTVAIVGISNKEDRASYQVAKWLQANSHFTLFFVNPVIDEVLGVKTYPSLSEIPVPIDMVDVFRRSEETLPTLEKSIEIEAKSIWLQLGIRNDEVAQRGEAAGMKVVMDRCLKVDYANLMK
jgi:predicted CoA-binding protein